MSSIICIYHANCPDGFGSAFAAWKRYGNTIDYYPAMHNTTPPFDLIKDKHVYLLDFSYKKDAVNSMFQYAKVISIIDHHKSAIENLSDVSGLHKILDVNKSGAVLAWEYFNKNVPVPEFLKYIQDRDLWKFELPNSKEVTTAILSYEYNFKIWDEFLLYRPICDLIKEGSALYRKHMKDILELIKTTKKRINILGYNVPIANAPYCYASDICDILCENEPFACSYYFKNNDSIYVSIRSKQDVGIDVSEIAKRFGGGGHKHASGFEITVNENLIQNLFN